MNEFVNDQLTSDPAIVVYTVAAIAVIALAVWASPVGRWLTERWAESRQMRQIDLLREYHRESKEQRVGEIADVLEKKINGSLGRIETNQQRQARQLSDAVNAAAERELAIERRLATGSATMESNGRNIADNSRRIDDIEKTQEGQARTMERVQGALDIVKKSL